MYKDNFLKSLTMSQIAMALTVGLGMQKDNVSVEELVEQCRELLPKYQPPRRKIAKDETDICCGKPMVKVKGVNALWCKKCAYSKIIKVERE